MSEPLIIGRIEYPTMQNLRPDSEHGPVTPGLRQVMEWARTYVDGETCIGEVPRDKLSPEERAGLEELERLEGLLPLHSPTQTPR